VLFKDQIETSARDLYVIGVTLIVLGLILAAADHYAKLDRDVEQIETKDGFWVGMAQALALIPGVSRSGATITAGLFLGLNRAAAARFSFLLSVPAVVLSGLFELSSIIEGEEGEHVGAGALVTATAFAFVVGYASIAFLLRFLANHTMFVFVAYRVVLGVLVLTLAGAGVIE
jgi:undecaprenyl-diphosphatase